MPREAKTILETEKIGTGRVLTGHLDGIDDEGRVLFQTEEAGSASFPVAIGLTIPDGSLVRSARLRQRALVLVTDDPEPRRVLISLVRDRVVSQARDAGPGQLEVSVDGETLTLTAQSKIELRCGKSSLLLRKDGRVEVRGTYLISRSTGPVKLKGASVAIN